MILLLLLALDHSMEYTINLEPGESVIDVCSNDRVIFILSNIDDRFLIKKCIDKNGGSSSGTLRWDMKVPIYGIYFCNNNVCGIFANGVFTFDDNNHIIVKSFEFQNEKRMPSICDSCVYNNKSVKLIFDDDVWHFQHIEFLESVRVKILNSKKNELKFYNKNGSLDFKQIDNKLIVRKNNRLTWTGIIFPPKHELIRITIDRYLEMNSKEPYLDGDFILRDNIITYNDKCHRIDKGSYYIGGISKKNILCNLGFMGLGSLDNYFAVFICHIESSHYMEFINLNTLKQQFLIPIDLLTFRFHSRHENFVAFENKGCGYIMNIETNEYNTFHVIPCDQQLILADFGYYLLKSSKTYKKVEKKLSLNFKRRFLPISNCKMDDKKIQSHYSSLISEYINQNYKKKSNDVVVMHYNWTNNYHDDFALKPFGIYQKNSYLAAIVKCIYDDGYQMFIVVIDLKTDSIKLFIKTYYKCVYGILSGNPPVIYGIVGNYLYYDNGNLAKSNIVTGQSTTIRHSVNKDQQIFPIAHKKKVVLKCYTRVGLNEFLVSLIYNN